MDNTKKKIDKEYKKGWVSVIVLSYNSDKYIYKAIDSICIQDYPLIELIIADDGSPQFDRQHMEEYIASKKEQNIVNVIVISREHNVGTVKNINNAICCSSGEFIKIIAGDDAYPSAQVISKQVKNIHDNNSLVSVGKLQQCNTEMIPIRDERAEKSNESIHKVLNLGYVDARRYITTNDIFPIVNQAMCYKKEFFIDGGLCDEDYILIEDSPLSLRVIKLSERVSELDEFTVNHRAKVGISTSRELFSPKRVLYYADCMTYSRKEVLCHPEIYGWLYRNEHLRTSTFVYKMAMAKKNNRSLFSRCLICVNYCDTIVYYSCTHFGKLVSRLKDRFFSR